MAARLHQLNQHLSKFTAADDPVYGARSRAAATLSKPASRSAASGRGADHGADCGARPSGASALLSNGLALPMVGFGIGEDKKLTEAALEAGYVHL
eukprot:SAG11_NODE_14662_length_604_cov_0.748515_1_plen_95_part_10